MVDRAAGFLAQQPALGPDHQQPPVGSQSIENGMVVGTVAITSALPSRSARICRVPQLDSHSRPSCQRADSPIFNPVSRISDIRALLGVDGNLHHRHERQPAGSTPVHGSRDPR